MVRERLHKIKKKDRRRPLTVRAIAVVMALAMVLSVIYVNNRGSKVEAEPINYSDSTYLGSIMKELASGGTYTVNVPVEGVEFSLPSAPAPSEDASETIKVKKVEEESEERYYPIEDESDPVEYEITVKKTTSYSWDSTSIGSPAANSSATAKLSKDVDAIYYSGDVYFKKVGSYYTKVATADLSKEEISSVADYATVEVNTYVPDDVSVSCNNEARTVTVTDSSYNADDVSNKTYYYGYYIYTIDKMSGGNTVSSVAKSTLDDVKTYLETVGNSADGEYIVTKYINSSPTISESSVEFYKSADSTLSTRTIERDFYLIDKIKVTYNSSTSEEDDARDYELGVTDVNPIQNVLVEFYGDNIDVSKTVITGSGSTHYSDLKSVDVAGTYSFTIPGALANKGKVYEYNVTVVDYGSHHAKDTFYVSVTYGNGEPTVSVTNTESIVKEATINITGKATIDDGSSATIVSDNVTVIQSASDDSSTGASNPVTSYDAATGDVTLSGAALTPGNNYFWIKAKSSYGTEKTSASKNIFYDAADPVIGDVTVKQDGNTIADGGKATYTKAVSATFAVTDEAPSSGIESVTVKDENDADVSVSQSGDTCTIDIASNSDNNGKTKTYTITAKDNSGRTVTKDFSVTFYDETITVTDFEINKAQYNAPEDKKTKYGITWEASDLGSNNRSFTITYKINSEIELESTASLSNGQSVSITKGSTEGEYIGTVDVNISSDTDISSLGLTVKNVNGVLIPSPYVIDLIEIDITNPATTSIAVDPASSQAGINDWYRNLVLLVTATDAKSGISSVVGTGVEDTGNLYDSTSGTIAPVKVNESTTTAGTPVSFTITDKAGNVLNTVSTNYKVDSTKPTATIKVNGVAVSGTIYEKKVNSIEFLESDTLSGVNAPATQIDVNGNVIGDAATANAKTFAELVGGAVIENSPYTFTMKTYDEAGNECDATSVTVVVDGSEPIVSVDYETKEKKTANYFNTDPVTLSLKIVEDNLKNKVLTVDGEEKNPTWTQSGNTYTATINVSGSGSHTVVLTAEDNSSSQKNAQKEFIIDVTDPAVVTLLNGSEYTASNSYYSSAVTTGIEVTDDTEDINDITATIYRDIPGDGSETQVKSGKGPFTISEDGRYTVTYKVVDKAGNETTKTIGFTVDKTFPVNNLYVTTDNPAKYDSYQNNYINQVGKFTRHKNQENYAYGQYYSSDVTIELGYFEYNLDWVYVTDNGVEIKPTWSETKGYGTATITISEEGYHEIKMWTCDLAGNDANDNSVGKTIRFTIDKTQPYLSIFVNGSQYTEGSGVRYLNTNANVTVSSNDTNNDSSDIKRYYKMTPPGGSSATTEAIIGDGTENFATEADYELQYTVTDKAGNISATRNVFFRVDKTAPQVSISDVGATSTASSVSLSFTVKEAFYWDMNPVKITIYKKKDGQGETLEKTIEFTPRSANDSTSYTFTDDAEYRMEMVAEDKCGNKTETKYAFIKDGTAPTIMLSGVSNYDKTDKDVSLKVSVNEAFYSTNKVSLSGTRTDIDGKKNNIEFDNFVTNRSQLSELEQLFNEDGIYDITVTSTDKAGNTTTKSVHFTIDTTDPEIGDLSKYDGIKTNKFEWDVNLDELVKDLTVCEINLYLDGALYDGTSEIADGSHVLRVEATDELGHKSFKEVTFVLDSKGPNIIVSNVEEGDRLLEATEVTVTVELDEDILDAVQLNGKTIEVNDNKAVLTIDQKGSYKLAAAAHDEAGNNTTAEVNFTFGKQTNLMIIGIIAGVAILLLILLLLLLRRRRDAR